jgi:plastocyanin
MKRQLLIVCLCAAISSSAAAATVSGKVGFVTKRGQRPVVNETLIWLDPIGRGGGPSPSSFTMTTRNKTFLPHVMAVPAGSTISFPNEDPIAHNLFSLTPGNAFDLGLYRKGGGRSQKFDTPGVVNVYCNIHPNMSAVVLVMKTPYYGFANAAGAFSFDVPPGRYRLNAWNEQGGNTTSDIEVKADGTVAGSVSLTIDSRNFRFTQHTNKHGQRYRPPRDY